MVKNGDKKLRSSEEVTRRWDLKIKNALSQSKEGTFHKSRVWIRRALSAKTNVSHVMHHKNINQLLKMRKLNKKTGFP